MARINNLTNFLTDVAAAIKTKTGDSTDIPASEFDTEILSIETGTDTSDATLDSGARMLQGYTAYANGVKYTGSITNRGDGSFTSTSKIQELRGGYYESITINPVPTQSKTATPTTSMVIVSPDTGKFLSQVAIRGVTSSIDSNITAGNIKNGVTILGVVGTYVGDSSEYQDYVDLVNLLTNNSTTGKGLFAYVFNGRNITNAQRPILEGLNVSTFTDMSYMFYQNTSLTSLDLSNWDTSSATSMAYMFYYCDYLTSIDLSGWDTSSVLNMNSMFYHCSRLTSLDLTDFDTSIVTNTQNMFGYCTALVTITGTIDMNKVLTLTGMFGNTSTNGAHALENVSIYRLNRTGLNLTYNTNLTHTSLMYLINNLVTTSSAKTLTLGATNRAKLTASEIAVATGKGWTIA